MAAPPSDSSPSVLLPHFGTVSLVSRDPELCPSPSPPANARTGGSLSGGSVSGGTAESPPKRLKSSGTHVFRPLQAGGAPIIRLGSVDGFTQAHAADCIYARQPSLFRRLSTAHHTCRALCTCLSDFELDKSFAMELFERDLVADAVGVVRTMEAVYGPAAVRDDEHLAEIVFRFEGMVHLYALLAQVDSNFSSSFLRNVVSPHESEGDSTQGSEEDGLAAQLSAKEGVQLSRPAPTAAVPSLNRGKDRGSRGYNVSFGRRSSPSVGQQRDHQAFSPLSDRPRPLERKMSAGGSGDSAESGGSGAGGHLSERGAPAVVSVRRLPHSAVDLSPTSAPISRKMAKSIAVNLPLPELYGLPPGASRMPAVWLQDFLFPTQFGSAPMAKLDAYCRLGGGGCTPADGWSCVVDEGPSDVRVWCRYFRGRTDLIFRLDGFCNSEMVPLLSIVSETEYTHQWVPFISTPIKMGLIDAKTVVRLGRMDKMSIYTFQLPWPLKNRFVAVQGWMIDDLERNNSLVFNYRAVPQVLGPDDIFYPEIDFDIPSNAVAVGFEGGAVLTPVTKDRVFVRMICSIDPKENLPKPIINFFAGKFMRLAFNSLRDACKTKLAEPCFIEAQQNDRWLYGYMRERLQEVRNFRA